MVVTSALLSLHRIPWSLAALGEEGPAPEHWRRRRRGKRRREKAVAVAAAAGGERASQGERGKMASAHAPGRCRDKAGPAEEMTGVRTSARAWSPDGSCRRLAGTLKPRVGWVGGWEFRPGERIRVSL